MSLDVVYSDVPSEDEDGDIQVARKSARFEKGVLSIGKHHVSYFTSCSSLLFLVVFCDHDCISKLIDHAIVGVPIIVLCVQD